MRLTGNRLIIFQSLGILVFIYVTYCRFLAINVIRSNRRSIAVVGVKPIATKIATFLEKLFDVTVFTRKSFERTQEYIFDGLDQSLFIDKNTTIENFLIRTRDELQAVASYLKRPVEEIEELQRRLVGENRPGSSRIEIDYNYQGFLEHDDGIDLISDKIQRFDAIIFAGHDDFGLLTRMIGTDYKIKAYIEDANDISLIDLLQVDGDTIKALPNLKTANVLHLTGQGSNMSELQIRKRVYILDPLTICNSLEPDSDMMLIGYHLPLLLQENESLKSKVESSSQR